MSDTQRRTCNRCGQLFHAEKTVNGGAIRYWTKDFRELCPKCGRPST